MRSLKSLFLAVVVVFAFSAPLHASYRDTVLSDGPVAYWRLGETAGSVAYDSSGNGHDALFSGPVLGQPGAIVGDPDPSAFFGSYGVVQRSDSIPLMPRLDPWTVEAWVKVPATGTLMEIVSWYPGGYLWGHNSAYLLGINQQGLPFYQVQDLNANGSAVTGPTPITDSAWHHVVGVLDRQGGSVRLYVDGNEVASAPFAVLGLIADSGIALNIGRQYRYWTAASQFEGMMDEVALYRSVLSAERVRLHYDTGRGLASDADGDAVADGLDRCPGTPSGSAVDASGCITQCPSQLSQGEIDAAVQHALASLDATCSGADALIAQKDAVIASLNGEVNFLTAALSAKDQTVASLESAVAALEASLSERESLVTALDGSIAHLKTALAEKDRTIEQLRQQIASLNGSIAAFGSAIAEKDLAIAALSAQVGAMVTQAQLEQAVLDAQASAQQALLAILTANLRRVFGDAGFEMPGGTALEKINSFTNAIGRLPAGQIKKLHELSIR